MGILGVLPGNSSQPHPFYVPDQCHQASGGQTLGFMTDKAPLTKDVTWVHGHPQPLDFLSVASQNCWKMPLGGEWAGVGKPEPLPHTVKPRGVDRACNQGQSPRTPGASTAPMHTCELEDLHERGLPGLTAALALRDPVAWGLRSECRGVQTACSPS